MARSTLSECLSPEIDSTAIIIPREPIPIILSHRELARHVLSLQVKLAAIGISHQDAVAIVLPNSLEFVVAFVATSLQRAICAPLNPAYKKDEFEFYLNDLNAAVVLVPKGTIAENGEAIQAARTCNTAVAEISWDWCEVTLPNIELRGLTGRAQANVASPEVQDCALILHTSGTTGRPKAVPLTHKNLWSTAMNIQKTYDLTSVDRTLLVMPLFHVHGLLAGFLAPLMSRGSVIVPVRFSASEFWRDFVNFNSNWFTAVPTIHQILLKNPLPSPMPPIRFVRSCSSPLAPTVHQRLETQLNAPIIEAYAMTEAAHQITSNPLPPGIRRPGSVGIPQGVSLKIIDEAGNPLLQGQIGEVSIRGENVTSGYLGDPNVVTTPFTPAGYLRTGDQGYLDKDGYLFLTGRIKELINKGGEKISPVEIDNVLVQHPKVLEAVCFAIDDDLYGQDLAVAVVLQEGAQLPVAELLAWFAERVAKFKVPKKVYYTEKMPKTATGKVQRRLVAESMTAATQPCPEKGSNPSKPQSLVATSEAGCVEKKQGIFGKSLAASLRRGLAKLLALGLRTS
ncbi:MAG: hypothetical protein Q9163_003417 [Psora crenata]